MGTMAQSPQPALPTPPAPPTTDWISKSIDVLTDATKQLITIATGIITATVIFSKDLSDTARGLVLAAWIMLSISVVLGVLVLYNISGHLFNTALRSSSPNILTGGMRPLSRLQVLFFFLGIVLVFLFGFVAVKPPTIPDAKPITVNCVIPTPMPPASQQSSPQPSCLPRSHRRMAKGISTEHPAQ